MSTTISVLFTRGAGGRLNWIGLIAGCVFVTILSLTVHAYMLEGMHIPYPENLRQSGAYGFPDFLLMTIAVGYLYRFLDQRLAGMSKPAQCLLLFVLISTIRETLIRSWFMELADTVEITIFPVVAVLPRLIVLALVACAVVAVGTRIRGTPGVLLLAGIAAVVFFVCKPPVDALFARLLQAISYLESPVSWQPPYDYHILVPAYLTFLEPVCGTLAVGLLTWDLMPAHPVRRIIAFSASITAIKGPVITTAMYVFYSGLAPGLSLASAGQFTLETLALAVLSAMTLQLVLKPKRRKA